MRREGVEPLRRAQPASEPASYRRLPTFLNAADPCVSGKSVAVDGDGWEGGAVHVDTSNGIVLEYDTFGDPDDPAILLIMGFGTQLLGWDAEFCRLLGSRRPPEVGDRPAL